MILLALLLICFLNVFYSTNAQLNCAQAPTPAIRIFCEQLHRWDRNARATPPVSSTLSLPPGIPGFPPGMAGELALVPASPYQCMDLQCLSGYGIGGGMPLQKAIRKEYRMLSDDERARFHAAMKAIKASGEYDNLARVHAQFAESGSAHAGPGFLPWHREFIKRFEFALRQVDPSVAIPFWDSTLDGQLPTPADSIMFTADFMGATDAAGNLVVGDFKGWRTLEGRANVLRRVGAQGTCFKENEINHFLSQIKIEYIFAYTAPQRGCTTPTDFNVMEYTHGNVHLFMGGDMVEQSTTANDPIFWLLHSFVDMLWETWRLTRQDRNARMTTYQLDNSLCSAAVHFGSGLMRPFEPMRNIDGLENKYTDNLYQYGPRPNCNMGPTCGSKYLFCDRSHAPPHCAAKIKVGGNCRGFVAGEQMCYNGVCQNGRCVQTRPTAPIPTRRPTPVVRPRVASTNCYNEHECCGSWAAKGECSRNPGYMRAWCKASCGVCRPSYSLQTECSNRHPNCVQWSRQGECSRNKFWMAENCRQVCAKCGNTRAQVCSGGRGAAGAIVTPTAGAKCTSPGCYNENPCCQVWGRQGECSRNPNWMRCQCRVSCGGCTPNYAYGSCADYSTKCRAWALQGECRKNDWMLENCRASCQKCLSNFDLVRICANSRGAIGAFFGAGRRRRHMNDRELDDAEVFRESVLERFVRYVNATSGMESLISGPERMPESSGMPSIKARL